MFAHYLLEFEVHILSTKNLKSGHFLVNSTEIAGVMLTLHDLCQLMHIMYFALNSHKTHNEKCIQHNQQANKAGTKQ